MDVERERRWNALLVAALEVDPKKRRSHLEARGDADAELIDEVLASLRSEEGDLGDFLEEPAVLTGAPAGTRGAHSEDRSERRLAHDRTELAPTPLERPATAERERVGPYRLLERVGEGGMGVVYVAEQTEPVRRRVALKLIKGGMDSRELLGRFHSERQALALMSHPNIARILDAGSTEDGHPYFVMEYVRGVPLLEYCDGRQLSIDERLELFVDVCTAVQHAHQKGVIHRDLKPSNILVEEVDGKATPKVIDFGVAKAVHHRLSDITVHTRLGGFIGTPEYVSPEQAETTAHDVDTRADIYSLGAVLYELLTGLRPFDFRETSFAEIQRILAERDPKPPSARVREGDNTGFARAQRRRADTEALYRKLRGDLDWITMQALAKDRARRYASASELAADLERHRAHETVLARPPSTAYRIGRFVRRHNLLLTVGTVAIVALVVGTIGTSIGLIRAREEAANARAALDEAREVSDFLIGLFREADPTSTDGEELTVVELLDRGAEQIRDRFAGQPAVRGRLLQTLAEVQLERGFYDRAEPMLREAAALFNKSLPQGDPARASVQGSFGVLYSHRRDWVSAEAAFRRALAEMGPDGEAEDRTLARHNLGVAILFQNRLDEAEEHFRAALELRRQALPKDHPHLARSFNALGALLVKRNRPHEALPFIQASVEHRERTLGPRHPDLAKALVNLATAERKLGFFERAVEHASRAVSIEERTLGPDHPDLGTTLKSLVESLAAAGRVEDALLASDRVLRIRRLSGAGGKYLTEALSRHAGLLAETGRLEEAETLYRELAGVYEEATKPGDPLRTVPRLGLAFIAWKRGDSDRAEQEAREVHEIRKRAAHPIGTANLTLRILAGVARARGDLRRAEELYRRGLEMGPTEENTDAAWPHRLLREEYAEMLQAAGRTADAEAVLGTAPKRPMD